MVAVRLTTFAGMIPIRDPRLLPEQVASQAVNARTDGGALKGINVPRFIKSLQSSTRRVYRLPYTSSNTPVGLSDLDTSVWVEFSDRETDVLRSPTINDSFDRYYWCSPSAGLRYASRAQFVAGSLGLKVGVRAPAFAPNVVPIAGTGAIEEGVNTGPKVTRSYVVTWVSEFGEESAPSPPSEAAGASDQDWLVSSIPVPSAVSDEPTITNTRLYRTVTSASGVSTFFLVAQFSASTSVYTDQLSDTVVTGQRQLESTAWERPPPMDGVAAMPNGIFVGWKGNTLYFSENYRPHAWPVGYAITVQHPIVGLGVFGNTCVVCTTGAPAAVSGVKSNTMALTQSNAAAPCLSRGSIVAAPEGVYYASDAGLVLFGPAGMKNVTEEVISRDQWLSQYKPSTIRAFYSRGQYIALRGEPGPIDGFMMAPIAQTSGLNGVVSLNTFTAPDACGVDAFSGRPWLIDGNKLYEWEPVSATPALTRWRSKEFHLPEPANFAGYMVFFDVPTPADATAVKVRVWADGRLVYDAYAPGNARETRLPSGFKATIWQFEVETKVRVHSLHVATSIVELRRV